MRRLELSLPFILQFSNLCVLVQLLFPLLFPSSPPLSFSSLPPVSLSSVFQSSFTGLSSDPLRLATICLPSLLHAPSTACHRLQRTQPRWFPRARAQFRSRLRCTA